MNTSVDDLRDAADRLRAALNAYERFVDGWPYERSPLHDEVDSYHSARDATPSQSPMDMGAALAADVEERYYRARELEGEYVQRARASSRTDWARVVSETEPVWRAAQRVHAAGYGIDPRTGEPGYLLPAALCPARRVSMNAGSSPVVYDNRVAQYGAVADRFDISPDVVYHPGSGHDVSTSKAFPDSRVVYSDVDAASMADLRRAGYESQGADAVGYEVDDGADMLVFRNAGLFEEAVVAANLRPGGWVLANDHLESARHVSRLPTLELVAVVPAEWPGDVPPVDTVDAGDCSPRQRRLDHSERADDGRSAASSDTADSVPAAIEGRAPLDLYVFRRDE